MGRKMKRKLVIEVLEAYVYIESIPLPEVMEQLQAYQELYGNTYIRVWLNTQQDKYEDYARLVVMGEREENDQEYTKRVALVAKQNKDLQQSELRLLEQLKKKYEK